MRLLICGDRHWSEIKPIRREVIRLNGPRKYPSGVIEVIISGHAPGADILGEFVAEELEIPTEVYPAQWDVYGRAAGPIRNQQMLDEGKPTHVLAFHPNLDKSKGTKDMVTRAMKAGVKVEAFRE